jgi:tRNA 2-thiocytidine biosynthesis protein TtcA
VPSHLMDGKRHDFKGIRTTGVAEPDGDRAFDDEAFREPFATGSRAGMPGLSVVEFNRPALG